jgi:hypothetical protein
MYYIDVFLDAPPAKHKLIMLTVSREDSPQSHVIFVKEGDFKTHFSLSPPTSHMNHYSRIPLLAPLTAPLDVSRLKPAPYMPQVQQTSSPAFASMRSFPSALRPRFHSIRSSNGDEF